MEVTRGELITVVLSREYGKPRPALVIQSDQFDELPSVTVLPLTSDLHDEHLVRVTVQSDGQTGLKAISQIMIDKISTVPRDKIRDRIGRVDDRTMRAVDSGLAGFLALS